MFDAQMVLSGASRMTSQGASGGDGAKRQSHGAGLDWQQDGVMAEELHASRGVVMGLLMVAPLWGVIGMAVYFTPAFYRSLF